VHLPAIARSPRSSIGCPLPSLADVVFPRVQERLANASRSPQAEGLAGVQLLLIEDPLPLTLAQLEGTLHDSNRACSCQPCLVPGWRVFSPLGLVAVGAVSRRCAGIAATATLCAAAGDEKRPVFLALGPKAAEMRQSPGDLVLAFVSLLACSFTVLGYALSSFSTPLHHYPRHPVEPHTSCTDKAYAQPVASPTTPQRHQTPWRRNSSYRRRQADRAAAER
jgi:hypothetical protein